MSNMACMQLARNGAQHIANGFRYADDDWAPMLIARTRDGHIRVTAVPLGDDKDTCATAIRDLLHAEQAIEAALVMSAWKVAIAPGTDTDVRPSQHPEGGVRLPV